MFATSYCILRWINHTDVPRSSRKTGGRGLQRQRQAVRDIGHRPIEAAEQQNLQDLVFFCDLHRLDHFEGRVVECFGCGCPRLGHFLQQRLEQVHGVGVELEADFFEVEVQVGLEVLVDHVVVVVAVEGGAAGESV